MADRHFPPPPLAERLVARALDEAERSARLGDLEERYQCLIQERGEMRARAWYRWQALLLVVLALINNTRWSGIMFKNNLVIAWRNIKRSKVYSALNILGLAAGMAVFLLIMLYVRYEFSYDRYHANAKNVYRIVQEVPGGFFLGSNVFAVTSGALAPALVREFPEVPAAARIIVSPDVLIGVGEQIFVENQIHWADPQIFEIFSFPLVQGDRASALKDPFSILFSEREAHRLFGGLNPIGQTIVYRVRNQNFEFTVTGVFRDIPSNSHFTMDAVAPFETLCKFQNRDVTNWNDNSFYTYVLLKSGTNPQDLEAKLLAFIDNKYTDGKINARKGGKNRLILQPLTRIHLFPRINKEICPTVDARFVLLFATTAVLVLIIACGNYMNLAAAKSLKRTKEVGLRKVVGATKGQIVRQLLGDSMLIAFFALLLAVGIVLLVLPAFRAFVERNIVFDPLRDINLILQVLLLAVLVGGIAGSYPAFFASAFKPASALKGTGTSKSRGRGLRNSLIVFQFTVSIALIICTLAVRSQLRYIQNVDMGYEREQILVLPVRRSHGLPVNIEAVKSELKRNPAVLNLAVSSSLPNNVASSTNATWPEKPNSTEFQIYALQADYDFADLYGLEIVRGRNFSRDFPSDARGAFLINESAAKAIGWDDPVGRYFSGKSNARGTIVGVVRDFHMHSLHLPIMPLYIFLNPNSTPYISIKVRVENIPAALVFISKTWERFLPEYPFEYSFFDDIFDQAYRSEQRLGTIINAFAGLAVLIACLGLLGLASFTAEQKTKEIGIRKVLGASSSGIIVLLSRDFLKWVVVANLVAWPVGYFAMRSWLENFAYRIDLTVPMFLGAALAAFVIAAAVIGAQTYRAAAANPADSIRYE